MTGSQVEEEELRVDKSVAKSSLITVRKCQHWQRGRCGGGMNEWKIFFLTSVFSVEGKQDHH